MAETKQLTIIEMREQLPTATEAVAGGWAARLGRVLGICEGSGDEVSAASVRAFLREIKAKFPALPISLPEAKASDDAEGQAKTIDQLTAENEVLTEQLRVLGQENGQLRLRAGDWQARAEKLATQLAEIQLDDRQGIVKRRPGRPRKEPVGEGGT